MNNNDFAANVKADVEAGNIEAHPEAFRFEKEGDFVLGTVTGFGTGFSKKYGSYPIIRMMNEQDKKEVSVHVFHVALLTKLQNERVEPGMRIAIIRAESRTSASTGNDYVQYAVRVDPSSRKEQTAQSFGDFAAGMESREGAETDTDLPF